jgi:hypothetical protein
MNKIFEIKAEVLGVTGSYAQNRLQKYHEFYFKDWTIMYLHFVLNNDAAIKVLCR